MECTVEGGGEASRGLLHATSEVVERTGDEAAA
jgi:hypothetical protein